MALINTSFISAPFQAVATTFKAVGTTVSAVAVLGEGFADKAHRYNARTAREDELADQRATKVSEAAHNALLLSMLADATNTMTIATEKAAAAKLNQAVGKHWVSKAQSLTPEQIQKLAEAGKDFSDPAVMRSSLKNLDKPNLPETSTGTDTEDEPMDELTRLLNMNS